MEQPIYLQRLARQKLLLAFGAVVALVAGLFAGFTFENGQLVTRAEKSYGAATTILLTSQQPTIFQVEIPGQTQALPLPGDEEAEEQELIVEERTPIDLSESAVLLAYLAASDEIEERVVAAIGELGDGEAVTAVSRTTQPTGDERFPGRLNLPIVDVVGQASSAARAELLSQTAANVFEELVIDQQNEWGVDEDIRIVLDVLNAPEAEEGEGSNPAIPIVVTGAAVFLLFVGLALLLGAIRDRRARRDLEADADESDVESDSVQGYRRTRSVNSPARADDEFETSTTRSSAT